jgi:two-component system cell cycle response regulator DivK
VPSPPESPLVLVVDDMEDGREICAEYLSFCKYRVATAEDGLEALVKASELLPDVILMDLSLPRLDGWEATRRLKENERTRSIPVIALTAHALMDAKETALAAGCDAVVIKPCLPRDLEIEIRRMLESRAAARAAAREEGAQ